MAREWEPEFIRLWQAGASTDAIAAALGIPEGTARSRAYTLQQEGKIQPRPKGGRRTQSAGAMQSAVHNPVHNALAHITTSPDVAPVLTALLERLSAIEEALKRGGVQNYAPEQSHAPVQSYAPVQVSALPSVEPPRLSAEERKSERWNIYMPRWIRQRIERAAAQEGMSPSQFLQRLCGPWAATWQVEREEQ